MRTLTEIAYTWLVVVGLIDIVLVLLAQRRAQTANVLGRLLATLLTLAGLVAASSGRLAQPPPMNGLTFAGLVGIDIGLVMYALYLPAVSPLRWIKRMRRKGRRSAA